MDPCEIGLYGPLQDKALWTLVKEGNSLSWNLVRGAFIDPCERGVMDP